MITDSFCKTIALGDWTLFSSSTMVRIIFRLRLGNKPVLLRASKHPALTMRKPTIKGILSRDTVYQHAFLSDV